MNGLKIAANVYTPAGYDGTKEYPALVVAHPNGGVKEQVAGLYSQRMAEQGYICLAFDAAYQGASEGEPRNTDRCRNVLPMLVSPVKKRPKAVKSNMWET